MSEWYTADRDDISLSMDKETIEINFTSNDNGNVWVEVKIKDIIDLLSATNNYKK